MALDHAQRAFDAGAQARSTRDQTLTVTMTQPEEKLVTEHRAEPGDGDDQGEIEIAAMRRIAGEQQHGFAFEYGAEKHGGIAELRDQGGEIHGGKRNPQLAKR